MREPVQFFDQQPRSNFFEPSGNEQFQPVHVSHNLRLNYVRNAATLQAQIERIDVQNAPESYEKVLRWLPIRDVPLELTQPFGADVTPTGNLSQREACFESSLPKFFPKSHFQWTLPVTEPTNDLTS